VPLRDVFKSQFVALSNYLHIVRAKISLICCDVKSFNQFPKFYTSVMSVFLIIMTNVSMHVTGTTPGMKGKYDLLDEFICSLYILTEHWKVLWRMFDWMWSIRNVFNNQIN